MTAFGYCMKQEEGDNDCNAKSPNIAQRILPLSLDEKSSEPILRNVPRSLGLKSFVQAIGHLITERSLQGLQGSFGQREIQKAPELPYSARDA